MPSDKHNTPVTPDLALLVLDCVMTAANVAAVMVSLARLA
jgi:hypothetical protein